MDQPLANFISSERREPASASPLHEDVLTHITRRAVQSVAEISRLNLSEETSTTVATWLTRMAKSVPLFIPGGGRFAYTAAAVLYGVSEARWGDRAEDISRDLLLGGLKGVALKGSMEAIGCGTHRWGISGTFWGAPATGLAFGASSTLIESGLSRSTYCDSSGTYRGLLYGFRQTALAVANIENLAIGAATFAVGASGTRFIQSFAGKPLISSLLFQNTVAGFSFGAFSGMADETRRQMIEGSFNAWQISRFDFNRIGRQGILQASSDAVGAALGAGIALHRLQSVPRRVESAERTHLDPNHLPANQASDLAAVPIPDRPTTTIEAVQRIDRGSELTIRNPAEINEIVETPLRRAVACLWENNIRTVGSGVYHVREPKMAPVSFLHIGEYEPPYYRFTIDANGRYQEVHPAKMEVILPTQEAGRISGQKPLLAYIVIDELGLSPENQLLARTVGRLRADGRIELNIPVELGTDSSRLEQAMLEVARSFQPQPLTWGYQTPTQFYRQEMNAHSGVPSAQWLNDAVSSPQFHQRGLIYDQSRNLIFASQELATKYAQSPPPEPTWYRGPEIFGYRSRGGWRQAYIQCAVHLYTPAGQHIERSLSNARIAARNFEFADLMRPENIDYYLADKQRFFQLFGSRAYDELADRHWLELRNAAFESVERHWPVLSLERDRAIGLGTAMLGRACEQHGHVRRDPNEAGWLQMIVPQYLWREASGRPLSPLEVIDRVNRIYDDMQQARSLPFDHTFARRLIERMNGPDGDTAQDRVQFRFDGGRSLDRLLGRWPDMDQSAYSDLYALIEARKQEGQVPTGYGIHGGELTLSFGQPRDQARLLVPAPQLLNDLKLGAGLQMAIHPTYVSLLRELAERQSQGFIPERFEQSTGADGLTRYTPVYRTATVEEQSIPLSELVKNLRIVDYGFRNRNGPVLGKVSLASHDVHDHARVFWLLEREGLFDGSAAGTAGTGYRNLMDKLTDPLNTGIFKREGELVASIAYDWRNYFEVHPSCEPSVDLRDVRDYFLDADRRGIPLSSNQAAALSYVEELLRTDPAGGTPTSRRLRHILGGVWLETLEQKRKTETTLWQRSDGTYQRMSVTNPEYLAFVIDATRILESNGPELVYGLSHTNFKMESYLREIAALAPGGADVPRLHYQPVDVTAPRNLDLNVPPPTRRWLMMHPGFNTRRAPIRNWLFGGLSEFEQPSPRSQTSDPREEWSAERRRQDYQSREWRDLMYGP